MKTRVFLAHTRSLKEMLIDVLSTKTKINTGEDGVKETTLSP
jgi:hypothetical protein